MRPVRSKAVAARYGSAAVILAIGVAVLVVLSGSGGTAHLASNPNPKSVAVDRTFISSAANPLPASLGAAFHDLGHPAGRADAIPSALVAGLQNGPGSPGGQFAVNPSQARRVGESNGEPLWLVPGATGSCLLDSDGGAVCATNTVVETRGLMLAKVPVDGGPPTVIGVLPDGATASATATDGTVHQAAVAGSTYTIAGADATKLTIRSSAGKTFAETMPGSAPPTAAP